MADVAGMFMPDRKMAEQADEIARFREMQAAEAGRLRGIADRLREGSLGGDPVGTHLAALEYEKHRWRVLTWTPRPLTDDRRPPPRPPDNVRHERVPARSV